MDSCRGGNCHDCASGLTNKAVEIHFFPLLMLSPTIAHKIQINDKTTTRKRSRYCGWTKETQELRSWRAKESQNPNLVGNICVSLPKRQFGSIVEDENTLKGGSRGKQITGMYLFLFLLFFVVLPSWLFMAYRYCLKMSAVDNLVIAFRCI